MPGPVPLFPGFDTLGTLEHIVSTGHAHSWFVLTQKIIEKEFALSGSEQNPDITGRDLKHVLKGRLGSGAPGPGPVIVPGLRMASEAVLPLRMLTRVLAKVSNIVVPLMTMY